MALTHRLSTATILCCVATATAALTLSACGAHTSAPPQASANCTPGKPANAPDPSPMNLTVPADPASAAKVPAAAKAKGVLTIASDPSYAPNEFSEPGSNQIIGMDVDLGNAIAQTLGLKAQFVSAQFDGILAGLQSGRYDLGMSSFTDTKEREKTVDFVTYFSAGTSIMVQQCDPKNIKTTLDLCGKTVGAEAGTTQIDQLTKPDVDGSVVKACKDAGKQPPVGKSFPSQTDVNNNLQAGRIDAYMADSPVVDYALKKTGNAFEKVGQNLDTAPYGIAVPKTAGTLKDALQSAVQKLMGDGTYKQILDHWGVGSGAISTSQINGATS